MKRYKLYYVAAGLTILSIIGTGIYAINKKDSKNNSSTPDNQIANEKSTLDEATQYRINTMATIYNFVDKMNSINALTVDNKTLMFTMEEGSALYVNLNNLTKEEFCNLYGNSDANYEDIKSNFESAMLKLRIYFARITQTSSVSDLITDEASKEFFSTYEDLHVDYNNLPAEDRKDSAKDIIAQFNTDYIDGSKLPYTNVNPGVARIVLATFQEGDQIGWANSSVKFPEDINKILEDTIEPDLCRTTDNNLKDLVNSLETIQIANEVVNGTTSEGENSYIELLNYFVTKLTTNGNYSSVDAAIDANNPDIFNNNNGKVSETSNKSSENHGGNSGGKKTTEESGKNLSSDDMDKEIKGLKGDLKDSAEDQKETIDKKYEDKNAIEVKKAAEFKKGYNFMYADAYESAKNAGIKMKYRKSSRKDVYYVAYIDGCNAAIDDAYKDGIVEWRANQAIEATVTSTPSATPTPGVTNGTSSNNTGDNNNSSSNNNGSTSMPSLGDGVNIDNGYIDENGKPEFDGPVYDKDGNIVGKANIRQDAINVLYAARDAIISTACINSSSYNEARAKKYSYTYEYNRGISL
jgi:hypothetical protein